MRLSSSQASRACGILAVGLLAAADLRAGVGEVDKYLGTQWFGVYIQGTKSGYAQTVAEKTTFRGQPTYHFGMTVLAKVNVLGAVQDMHIEENKHFDSTGKLVFVSTVLHTTMGKMVVADTQIEGLIQGDKMRLTSTAAKATTTSVIDAPKETLDDYLAANRLAERGSKVGDKVEVTLFEGSMQRSLRTVIKVVAKKKILFNGVEVDVTELESLVPELGVATTSYVDTEGNMIETKFGGLLVLRAESETQAKNDNCAFDAIRASVIPVDNPIAHSNEVTQMTAELDGLSSPKIVLDTPRQRYTKLGDGKYRLVTQADDVSALKPLAIPVTDPKFATDLQSTPLLQCDHPRIRAQAKEIIGSEKQAWPAAKRINAWVWATLEKVGTAALSNALETLDTKRGDCTEHTALFVALCRAAGIPARPCTGLVYWERGGGFGYHQWAAVYVGKWVEIDPTFNQPVADATHIKLAEGDWASASRIISVVGTLKIRVLATK